MKVMPESKNKTHPGPAKRFHERFETRLTQEEAAALSALVDHLSAVSREQEPYDKSKTFRLLLKWSGEARFRAVLQQLEFEETVL